MSTERLQPAGDSQHDAFGPSALATFALNSTGTRLFRVQHQRILAKFAEIITLGEAVALAERRGTGGGQPALLARKALTAVSSMLQVHQSLENAMMRRTLGADPRTRPVAEQFERDMAPLQSQAAALARHFPTPGSIMASTSEFVAAASAVTLRLQERIRAEERELLPLVDRLTPDVAGPAPSDVVVTGAGSIEGTTSDAKAAFG